MHEYAVRGLKVMVYMGWHFTPCRHIDSFISSSA